MKKRNFLLIVLLAAVLAVNSGVFGEESNSGDFSKPVKVFIMMGQSNMLGFGRVGPENQKGTLSYLVKQGKYPHLVELDQNGAVKVDEKGTEAAAATAVGGFTKSIQPMNIFNADHPFIFIIQQKDTGNILFMGRVTDPTQ